MANIIEQIETYFKFQKEVYGDYLFIEKLPKPDNDNTPILIPTVNTVNMDKVSVNSELARIETSVPINGVAQSTAQTNISPQSAEIRNIQSSEIIQEVKMSITPNWINSATMQELKDNICNCVECPLGKTRKNFVFGSGDFNADIMVIGEGPGAEEDEQGLPFVGRSGQLLTKILNAINLQREDVFIANIVKCRPPNNRRPEVSEVNTCEPYLKKQIELMKPKFILALGLTAVDTLFKTKHKMGEIRGQMMQYHGIPTIATYHPAALLRNPNFKKDTWEDVQLLRRLYDDYLEKNK